MRFDRWGQRHGNIALAEAGNHVFVRLRPELVRGAVDQMQPYSAALRIWNHAGALGKCDLGRGTRGQVGQEDPAPVIPGGPDVINVEDEVGSEIFLENARLYLRGN